MTAYIVGRNLPGYMPESEPYAHDTLGAAKNDLIHELNEAQEHDHEMVESMYEGETKTRINLHHRHVSVEHRQARSHVRSWTQTTLGAGDTVYAGNLAYWVHVVPGDAETYNLENVEGYGQ